MNLKKKLLLPLKYNRENCGLNYDKFNTLKNVFYSHAVQYVPIMILCDGNCLYQMIQLYKQGITNVVWKLTRI